MWAFLKQPWKDLYIFLPVSKMEIILTFSRDTEFQDICILENVEWMTATDNLIFFLPFYFFTFLFIFFRALFYLFIYLCRKSSNLLRNGPVLIVLSLVNFGRSVSAFWCTVISDHVWAVDQFSPFVWTFSICWCTPLSFLGKCQNFTNLENVGD